MVDDAEKPLEVRVDDPIPKIKGLLFRKMIEWQAKSARLYRNEAGRLEFDTIGDDDITRDRLQLPAYVVEPLLEEMKAGVNLEEAVCGEEPRDRVLRKGQMTLKVKGQLYPVTVVEYESPNGKKGIELIPDYSQVREDTSS